MAALEYGIHSATVGDGEPVQTIFVCKGALVDADEGRREQFLQLIQPVPEAVVPVPGVDGIGLAVQDRDALMSENRSIFISSSV